MAQNRNKPRQGVPSARGIGEVFTDQKGRERQVVSVIGDFGPKPTLLVYDAKGKKHYLTPIVPLDKYGSLLSLITELKNNQAEAAVPLIIQVISDVCITDAPYFTCEFIQQSFDLNLLLQMAGEIITLATGTVNTNIQQYNEDPSVKNGNGDMNP